MDLKIESIKIGAFGKFKDFELKFTDGLNLVIGPNESGKTTLYYFMKCSLGSTSRDVLSKYKPWSGGEILGEVCLENGQSKTIQVNSAGASTRLLEEDLIESLVTLSDEEDAFDAAVADQKIVARMKKKMRETKQAEAIMKLIESLPNLEKKIIEEQKQIDLQLSKLKESIEHFQRIRRELYELEMAKKDMERTLQALMVEKAKMDRRLEESEAKIASQIGAIRAELVQKLNALRLEMKQLSLLPVISSEQFVKLNQLFQRIKELEGRINELRTRIQHNRNRLEETMKGIDNLRNDLQTDDLEKFKLKLRNLELSYRLVESNLDKLKTHEENYQKSWKVFERQDIDIQALLNDGMISSLEKLRLQVHEKMETLEQELLKQEKSKNRYLLLMLVLLLSTVATLAAGFLVSPVWHYVSIGLGGGAGALFLLYRKMERRYDELSDEKIKAQIELRNLERQFAQRKMPPGLEIFSPEELKRTYEQYKQWIREKQELEHVKTQVDLQVQELLSELKMYGAKALQDIPSVLVWLGQKVFELEKAQYEYLMLEKILSQDQKSKEQLERLLEELSQEFANELQKVGLKDPLELPEALNRESRIRELRSSIERAEYLLELCQNAELEKLAKEYPKLFESLQEKNKIHAVIENSAKQIESLTRQLERQKELIKAVEVPKVVEYLKEYSFKSLQIRAYEQVRSKIPEVGRMLSAELEELTGSYVEKFGSMLKELFALFSDLADAMTVDKDLSVKFFVASREQSLETVLSRGTLDQLALCYKIALFRTLNPKDPLPLILDNFLIRFDENRLAKAVELLTEVSKERQVIVLTSDTRLKDLLKIEPLAILKRP